MIDRKDGEDLLDVGELPDQLTDAVVVVVAVVVVAVKMAKLYFECLRCHFVCLRLIL
jgi:hypothetical protein